jgi:hypothetical protein
MTKFKETLAEKYLRCGAPHSGSREYLQAVKVDKIVKLCLTPPGAVETLMREPITAERFVFEEEPLGLMGQMIDAGVVGTRLMGETVTLPADNTWFEFFDRTEGERCGVLVSRQGDGFVLIAVVLEIRETAIPGMLLKVKDLPWRFRDVRDDIPGEVGEYCEVLWEVTDRGRARTAGRANQLMYDTLSCLFLLCVPRVCEVRARVSRSEKVRSRKPREHPAVEFKHVTMTIGVGSPRYEGGAARLPGESLSEHRTRLHRVTWHFRTYRYKHGSGGQVLRERPLVKMIPEHWRGDPEKGIVLRERTVRAPEKEVKT